MSDLREHLKELQFLKGRGDQHSEQFKYEAAKMCGTHIEELAALEADNARLREALSRIASDHVQAPHIWQRGCDACDRQNIARQALKEAR
jgi:hypothetical protein